MIIALNLKRNKKAIMHNTGKKNNTPIPAKINKAALSMIFLLCHKGRNVLKETSITFTT